jgi:NitT/TauT family transport system substrate-binding protein
MVLTLILLGAFSIRSIGKPIPVKVAVMTWAGAGPGFVAIRKGFFQGLPVELSIIDDTKARQAAFQNKEFEVYLTNPDQHPREVENGLPGTMFLVSDISYGADGLLARRDITHIAELRGKRIAYTQGTASDFMLSKALISAGLARSDVTLVTLDDPGIAVAALTAGQVDAALSWEPLMSQAVKEGKARIIFTSADVPDSIIGVFIAKDSLIQDEQRFKHFVEGWLRAVEYIKSNPDESYRIMAEGLDVSGPEIREMMAGIRLADRRKNEEFFALDTNGMTKMDRFVNDSAAYWYSVGLLNKQIEPTRRWVHSNISSFFTRKN